MEQEVTLDFLARAVTHYSSAYESIFRFTADHYTSQIRQMTEFRKELYDRSIEAGIAIVNGEEFHNVGVCAAIMNGFESTVGIYKEKIGQELDFFRSRCVEEIGVNADPRTVFLGNVENLEDEVKEPARKEMTRMLKETDQHREDERATLRAHFNSHVEQHSQYMVELSTKLEANEPISAADREYIEFKTEQITNSLTCDDILDKGKSEFMTFLGERNETIETELNAFHNNCFNLIYNSLMWGTHDSVKFIGSLKATESNSLKDYEECAIDYLERISGRLAAYLSINGSQNIIKIGSFRTEMKKALVKQIAALRSKLDSYARQLDSYMKDERKSVDVVFRELSAIGIENDMRPNIKIKEKYHNIDLSPYPKEALGRGGEGIVYRCVLPGSLLNSDEETVAVACKTLENRTGNVDDAMDEILSLFYLRHANIVPLLGRGFIDTHPCLIMELCPRSLAAVIDNRRESGTFLDPHDFTKWLTELTAGMEAMHIHAIRHGDLKPQNILIGADNAVKIADFGLSIRPTDINIGVNITSPRGTARYMAPEQHNGQKFAREHMAYCDVWSYGICVWEMISCRLPFDKFRDQTLTTIIGRNDKTSHPPLPCLSECESLVNMLRHCWTPALDYRFTFSMLVQEVANVKAELGDEIDADVWRIECTAWAQAKHTSSPLFEEIIREINRRHSL